ncbi:MAG TPA: NADH-quinone oxidoreductase subunit F, partial [Candidatus Polarisedimenticolia bacterium]|nr:NADH-quinone oxidoreductase subunit F [Candidatus Polarisedimenticolia bacterium]
MTSGLLTRPVSAGPETLDEYRAGGGWKGLAKAVSTLTPDDVVRLVTETGLRGRGGAAFPTGRKWALAAAQQATPKYVVANGGEHEPGSLKDRLLLTLHPHKVLEGLAICAYATGASVGYLYLIEDMVEAMAGAKRAEAEARDAGLLRDLEIRFAAAPATYVAGEETAALEVIEGRRAWPRKKPPYPGESGLFGKPTTINNIETLACVPPIFAAGPAGAPVGAPVTMLFTLPDRVKTPGVHEMRFGATFHDLIYGRGGGPVSGKRIRGILPALSSSF